MAQRLWIAFWLGLPIAIVVVQVVAKAISPDFFAQRLHGEAGLVENATVIFLLVGVFTAVRLFLKRDRVTSALFGPFTACMALGCFFFAGEEASWGQHWFGFEAPSEIAERNEQGEFNLHNDPLLETVLDQLPRNLLTLAALIAIFTGLGRRGRIREFKRNSIHGWIWPTLVCVPSAFIAVFVTIPKKVFDEDLPDALVIGPGETKEFGIALFLLLYLVDLFRDLRSRDRDPLPKDASLPSVSSPQS